MQSAGRFAALGERDEVRVRVSIVYALEDRPDILGQGTPLEETGRERDEIRTIAVGHSSSSSHGRVRIS